jgi:hypothetical protein
MNLQPGLISWSRLALGLFARRRLGDFCTLESQMGERQPFTRKHFVKTTRQQMAEPIKSRGEVVQYHSREPCPYPSFAAEDSADRVARFRAVLASKQLTVYRLSNITESFYGASSPCFIPHNFLHYVVAPGVSPHICQVFTISKFTGYSLAACLELFGFPTGIISKWQLELHRQRTTLLPSQIYDKNVFLPFLATRVPVEALDSTTPFAKMARLSATCRACNVEALNRQSFLYARIGRDDATALPDLTPGSIVRVDPRRRGLEAECTPTSALSSLYLVEHSRGLSCCRVQRKAHNRILLAPHRLEFEGLEFALDDEAVILGTVDAEIRFLKGLGTSPVLEHRKVQHIKHSCGPRTNGAPLGQLLRYSRERIGLNLRTLHEMSLQLAVHLKNDHYQLSTSALWEIEANSLLPRHIEKVFSMCILYCLDLRDYLHSAHVPVDEGGQESLPPQYCSHSDWFIAPSGEEQPSQQLALASHLAEIVEEIPIFLRHGFPFRTGEHDIGARELYWVGQREGVFHPLLRGALLLAVDASRTGRAAERDAWKTPWERPVYLVLRRDGKYLCGFCSFKQNSVTVVPHPDCPVEPVHFVNGQEAEVVGQVTAVARLFR